MSQEPPQELTKDDLEEMLQCKVERFTSSPLTAPGENFGSLLLLVNAILRPDNRKVSIAAKLVVTKNLMGGVPPFRDFVRKEIDMYFRVRPEFLAFQEEHGVPKEMLLDVIPECYGARTKRGCVDINQPIDETAVILMENLKASGYRLVDRVVGMDLRHAECVVTHLARFQAMAVVMKLKKPALFKDTVLKAAAEVKKGGPPPKSGPNRGPAPVSGPNHGPPPMSGPEHEPPPKFSPEQILTGFLNCVSLVPAIVEYTDRVKDALKEGTEALSKKDRPVVKQPFATLVHNDLWTNNILFSYDGSDNITGLKLIDFQMTSYGSPASDLIFFLYSSTSLEVSKADRDRLIELYHQEFTKWLELFDCDTKPFSLEAFMKEVGAEAPKLFGRILFMLRIFCMSQDNAPDINNPSAFLNMHTDNTGLGDIYFKKTDHIVKEFVERNWI